MAGYKGKQGRKRKPESLKIVQGTFRKDRENKLQPKPKAGIPTPARGLLDKDEKKQFDRVCKILNDMNVLAESDVIAVEILAQSLVDYYLVLEDYKKQPRTIEFQDQQGNPVIRKSPTVNIMIDSKKLVITLLARFGLEPSARASLNILQEDNNTEEDNPYAKFSIHR